MWIERAEDVGGATARSMTCVARSEAARQGSRGIYDGCVSNPGRWMTDDKAHERETMHNTRAAARAAERSEETMGRIADAMRQQIELAESRWRAHPRAQLARTVSVSACDDTPRGATVSDTGQSTSRAFIRSVIAAPLARPTVPALSGRGWVANHARAASLSRLRGPQEILRSSRVRP